jgi:hypothetical protein
MMTAKNFKAVRTDAIVDGRAIAAQELRILRDFRKLDEETRYFLSEGAADLVVDRKPTLKLVIGGA